MKYLSIIKRETKIMFLIVGLLFVAVLGVSYSLFTQVTDNTNNQVVTTGTLQIEYASSNGYITGDTYNELLPMGDSEGLGQSGYEFSVKNTGNLPATYQVYMYINYRDYNEDKLNGKVSGDLFEDLSSIKYNFQTNNEENTLVNILSNQPNINDEGIVKYNLYTGRVTTSNPINTHKLRIWLSEEIDVSNIGKYIYLKLEVTSYVAGQEENILCKKATVLHTETCEQTDSRYYCSAAGYATGDIITYGTIPSGALKSGDALTCDVNRDYNYDEETERFYYVTDKDENTAVLIYYNNTTKGVADNTSASGIAYNPNTSGYLGPQTGITNLPTTSQWKLPSVGLRDIKDESGNERVKGFSYERYAARLLTAQEINSACGITVVDASVEKLDNCNYLLENTEYSKSRMIRGYWLESPTSLGQYYAWRVSGMLRAVGWFHADDGYGFGTRPVIEVKKIEIQY